MASESSDTSVSLPEDLYSWLGTRADELGTSQDELLRQLLAAYRIEATEEPPLPRDEELVTRVEGLETRVENNEENFEEGLDDVRRRVVQVKQELDEKSPADHDHPEFERLQTLDERTDSLANAVDRLRTAIEEQDGRLDDVESELADVTAKLTRVASAVVEVQSRPAGDHELHDIKQTAAREGYTKADCSVCGETVSVALLAESTCPHCGASVTDIESSSGWFSNPVLTGEATDE